MKPCLIAITGPARGTVFELEGPESSLGRGEESPIRIGDAALSRTHCVVQEDAGAFSIEDLGSRNGTFVNDLPVGRKVLEHGDRIRVGNTTLIFLSREDAGEPVPAASGLEDAPSGLRTTACLPARETAYLEPGRRGSSAVDPGRAFRDLEALFSIGEKLAAASGFEAVSEELLRSAAGAVSAHRGALVLVDGDAEEPRVARVWRRQGETGRGPTVSRTVVRRVLDERVGLLQQDVSAEEALEHASSLHEAGVRSLLCVPLEAQGSALGCLYVDRVGAGGPFEKEDLPLLAAVGRLGALAVENARHLLWLEGENRRLLEDLAIEHRMIGESASMQEVYRFIAKAAPTDATVLIRGESGTGKELVARAIHENGRRKGKPFVAVNCAALAENLLESELFGHERGAFTGAISQKRGKLELAEGGTVFLDEIAEMSSGLQAKLLRVLQEREFERVGGTRILRLDARVVAATHRELEAEITAGRFRADLYYRLNVLPVTLPSLRERREDIPLLASYFVSKYAAKLGRRVLGFSPEARRRITAYDWPGNVRELENAVERAVVLGNGEVLHLEDLPAALLESAAGDETAEGGYHDGVRLAKRRIILDALTAARGNFTQAAKALGVHPNYLHRLVTNLRLREELEK